jgi:arginase
VDRLRALGPVTDAGALCPTPYRPQGMGCRYRDGGVTHIARRVAARVTDLGADERPLLVLGGDCTITVAVVASLLSRWPNLGMLYFDGAVDFCTPQDTESGILDIMVSAHLMGLVDAPLARIGPRYSRLAPVDVVYFGCHPWELTPTETAWLNTHPGPQ